MDVRNYCTECDMPRPCDCEETETDKPCDTE